MKTTGLTFVLRIVLVHFADAPVLLARLRKNCATNEADEGSCDVEEAEALFDGSELSTLSSRDSYNLVM